MKRFLSLLLANLSSCVCRAEILLEPLFSCSLWARNSKSIRVLGLRVAHTRSKKEAGRKAQIRARHTFCQRCEAAEALERTIWELWPQQQQHLVCVETLFAIFSPSASVQTHFEHKCDLRTNKRKRETSVIPSHHCAPRKGLNPLLNFSFGLKISHSFFSKLLYHTYKQV